MSARTRFDFARATEPQETPAPVAGAWSPGRLTFGAPARLKPITIARLEGEAEALWKAFHDHMTESQQIGSFFRGVMFSVNRRGYCAGHSSRGGLMRCNARVNVGTFLCAKHEHQTDRLVLAGVAGEVRS